MVQVSPGVEIIERDFTLRIPVQTSSTGSIVIAAEKGPINTPLLINTEGDFINTFGEPDDVNFKHWFTATNFLAGSDQLWVVRTEDDQKNVAGITVGVSGGVDLGCGTDVVGAFPTPKKAEFFPLSYDSVNETEAEEGGNPVFSQELFKIWGVGAGPYYEDVQVVIISNDDYTQLENFQEELAQATTSPEKQAIIKKYYTGTPATSSDAVWQGDPLSDGDNYYTDSGDYLSCSLLKDDLITRTVIGSDEIWEVDALALNEYLGFEFGPSDEDEFAILVYDPAGVPVESWVASVEPDKLDDFGGKMFAPDQINGNSNFIYFFVAHSEFAAAGVTPVSTGKVNLAGADPLTGSFNSDGSQNGSLGDLNGEIETQWREHFTNKETIEIDVLLDPDYPTVLKQAIDDICKNVRKDCMAILNIPEDKMVNVSTRRQLSQFATNMKNYINQELLVNSSYSAIYGQYVQIFDRFNEVNRWIPVTGQVGATIARIDFNQAQWWAPAGLNRGVLDNVQAVAINPTKAQRDILYRNGINPIVNFIGQGVVIYGQKTLQSRPSAFDRINVRRLFLHLERSIEKFARFFLFEINDEITRSRFRGLVNSFLAEVKSRRGVTDYLVVADSSNNTADVVDRNEFVAEILIKPARAIEYIKLVFTAVATGVSFSEVVGGA